MMALYLALAALLSGFCSASLISRRSCNRPECNPRHEPVENIFTAMAGYDILKGNPFADSSSGDPGFDDKGYIFLPTIKNADETYTLDEGITIRRGTNCDLQISTEIISTVRDYQRQLSKAMSYGSQLATNLEYDVKGGYDYGGAKIEASTKVPPLASSAFTGNKDFKENEKFFTEKKGVVTIGTAICSSYSMSISQTLPPKFHPAFIKILSELQQADNESEKKRKFKKFIDEFGTHYLRSAQMGSRIAITKRYTKNQVIKTTANNIQKCTDDSLNIVFGLIKSQSGQCTQTGNHTQSTLYEEYESEYMTTYGSKPAKSLAEWSQQDFDKPLPIRMTLDPIVNLFRDSFMDEVKDENGNSLKYKEILNWFLPKYLDYCEDNKEELGIEACDVANMKSKGCGWNDDCQIDQECINDKSKPEGYKCQNPKRIYNVIVKTSNLAYAGTDANAYAYLADVNGVITETFYLDNPGKHDLDAGAEDKFTFTSYERLGILEKIHVWHNNRHSFPGWHLAWIKVKDVLKDRQYTFQCNRWLAKGYGLSIDCYTDKNQWRFKKNKKKMKQVQVAAEKEN